LCGRYSATKDPAELAAEFDAVDTLGGEAPRPDHNVAPTKPVVAVVTRHPRDAEGLPDPAVTVRGLRVMRWGLIPHWAKDPSIGSRMINARADTAAGKPAFRTALARRRCLLPADGWFEWKREGKTKQPFFMTRTDGRSLALAGLWSTWHDPAAAAAAAAADPIVSCAVLTTDAVDGLTDIHDRMPLLLGPESWQRWLDPDLPATDEITELLAAPDPATVAALELRPVSSLVNSVKNNGPELVAPLVEAQSVDQPGLFS
jgi:putative SOS response-associated peptidase YedK